MRQQTDLLNSSTEYRYLHTLYQLQVLAALWDADPEVADQVSEQCLREAMVRLCRIMTAREGR